MYSGTLAFIGDATHERQNYRQDCKGCPHLTKTQYRGGRGGGGDERCGTSRAGRCVVVVWGHFASLTIYQAGNLHAVNAA